MLARLGPAELDFILHDWPLHARPSQRLPAPDAKTKAGALWRFWIILAGRGWGKTRTGAEGIKELVDGNRARTIALVGATRSDTASIMVEGKPDYPALMGVWSADRRPLFIPSKRLVRFWNGATGTLFSGELPERLRGPQHDAAWVDELPAFKYPQRTWDNLLFGLRHGEARAIVTTTPKRSNATLRDLITDPMAILTMGSTMENKENLADSFIRDIFKRYKGTSLERQELYGELLEDVEGALWRQDTIDKHRVDKAPEDLLRVVIGVDPTVAAHRAGTDERRGDECGIIAIGRDGDEQRYVLGDYTCKASPLAWAREVVKAYWIHSADRVVAEANNGGQMVADVINQVDERVPVELVHASRGKYTRAEPIAAIYEQGRVSHVGRLEHLEAEMTTWVPDGKHASPNRMDALVWALTFDSENLSSPTITFG